MLAQFLADTNRSKSLLGTYLLDRLSDCEVRAWHGNWVAGAASHGALELWDVLFLGLDE